MRILSNMRVDFKTVAGDFIQHCQQILLKLCTYNMGATKKVFKLWSWSIRNDTETQIFQSKTGNVNYYKSCTECYESSVGHWVHITRNWRLMQTGLCLHIEISGETIMISMSLWRVQGSNTQGFISVQEGLFPVKRRGPKKKNLRRKQRPAEVEEAMAEFTLDTDQCLLNITACESELPTIPHRYFFKGCESSTWSYQYGNTFLSSSLRVLCQAKHDYNETNSVFCLCLYYLPP